MDAQYRDGTKLTVEEITGIMIGVLLGGQHTSNVTGTWLLCHLLRDPEWKRKVLEEQEGLLPDGMAHPAALSYEQVQQMPLMDQVLSETLRSAPPWIESPEGLRGAWRRPRHGRGLWCLARGAWHAASDVLSNAMPCPTLMPDMRCLTRGARCSA